MGYLDNGGLGGAGTSPPGQGPDIFGGGMYKVQNYNVDPNAFTNPISTGQSSGGLTTGQDQLLNAANQAAPTLAPAVTSQGPGNTGQLGVADQYMRIANGQGPSVADVTAARQGDIAQQNVLSSLGSARGTSNPALAGYQVGQQGAQIQNQVQQNAIAGKTAEQLGALGAAGQAYGGVTANQQFNAQQQNQQALNQAQLIGQQRGLQGAELQNFVQNYAQQIANSMQGAQSGQQLQVQNNLGQNGLGLNAYNDAAGHAIGSQLVGLAGSVAGGLGKAAIMSDKTNKKLIKPAKNIIDKFLSSIHGKHI